MPFPRFVGNCPGNANQDARYKIKYYAGQWSVTIEYGGLHGTWLCAARPARSDLVDLVNGVKVWKTGQRGGSFFINEYKQVIVPNSADPHYYLAGYYRSPAMFDFNGATLSGDDKDLYGGRLQIGEAWVGSRHGIPYVLSNAQGARDIRYTAKVNDYWADIYLSDFLSREVVAYICNTDSYG